MLLILLIILFLFQLFLSTILILHLPVLVSIFLLFLILFLPFSQTRLLNYWGRRQHIAATLALIRLRAGPSFTETP